MAGVIVVAGEALVDVVLHADGSVEAVHGGAPFNTARTCGRLGADVAFVGVLSTDRFGTALAERLVADGVSASALQRAELPTTLALAEIDERGAATYRFYVDGTSAPALVGAALPVGTSVVFTGGLGLVLEPMASTIEQLVLTAPEHVLVMVDVNVRPPVITDRDAYVARLGRVIARADVVKVSDDDLAHMDPGTDPVDAARRLLAHGPSVVLLTRGGGGVTVLGDRGRRDVPVEAVDVVDTIGAGDSFGGAFVTWWVLGGHAVSELSDLDTTERAVRASIVVAGIVCTRRGADPPWRDELGAGWVG
jgi:fructokinase